MNHNSGPLILTFSPPQCGEKESLRSGEVRDPEKIDSFVRRGEQVPLPATFRVCQWVAGVRLPYPPLVRGEFQSPPLPEAVDFLGISYFA